LTKLDHLEVDQEAKVDHLEADNKEGDLKEVGLKEEAHDDIRVREKPNLSD
jgi:hypothetical protein